MPKKTTNANDTNTNTNDIINDVQALWEPWINAAKVWQGEAEKMRETALQNINRGLDDSHRMAKESLTMMSTFSTSVQKKVATQMERSRELFSTIISE